MPLEVRIKESPLFWPAILKSDGLEILDETQIPQRIRYIKIGNTAGAVRVIREMRTRAFGQFLVVLNTFLLELRGISKNKASPERIFDKIKNVAHRLNHSRPTFPFSEVTGVVVRWALMAIDSRLNICSFVRRNTEGYLESVRAKRLERVRNIASIIEDGDSILTHCNVSGELAMAAFLAKRAKKDVHVFVTETRPFMQGSKLTAWELKQMGVDVTLVSDNAVGTLMADGLVNKVIVGSDRSCANGDFANKIGTYQIAVVARHFNIPMFVLTQPSDKIRVGRDIPIEIRKPDELLRYEGKKYIRAQVDAFYPGFDIVPFKYVFRTIPIKVSENE